MYFHGSTGHQAEGIGGGKAGPSNSTACPVDFALIGKKNAFTILLLLAADSCVRCLVNISTKVDIDFS